MCMVWDLGSASNKNSFSIRSPQPLGSEMPDDLRWIWRNNNRNKVHNKCNVFESPQIHPPPNPRPCRLWSLVPKQLGAAALDNLY